MNNILVSVPERLRPMQTTRDGKKYRNFRDENLSITVMEKTWLFQEVLEKNAVREGEEEDQLLSKKGLVHRYGLHECFFKGSSYKAYLNHGDINLKGQRSSVILPAQLEVIQRTIAMKENLNMNLTTEETKKLIVKGIFDSSQLRNHPKPDGFLEKGIGNKFYKKVVKQYDIKLLKPGNIDQAQKDAREDTFLGFELYLVLRATGGRLEGLRKYNFDGTTHVFEFGQEGCKVATIADEATYQRLIASGMDDDPDIASLVVQGPRRRGQVKSLRVGCKLGFAIKLFLCINAGGFVAPMILVVAVKGMGEDDWHHEAIKGLSITNAVNEVGHMYFSKTRCGTKGMWKDILTRCIIPFILAVREDIPTFNHVDDDPEMTAQHDVLNFDNEDIIASNIYDPELLTLLRDSRIECCNLPPSTTPITQACDNISLFKETKRETKKVRREGTDVTIGKEFVVRAIQDAFKNLKVAFPGLSVGAAHINNIVAGSMCLLHSYTKCHDPTEYVSAFKRLGQHCARNPETGLTIDFKVLMNKFYRKVAPAELDFMESIADRLITQYVIPNGRMSYADMLAEEFTPGPTTINRDNVAAQRRSSQIMTSVSCQARQAEWVRVHSPEYAAEKQQEAADLKILQQDANKTAKEGVKKAKLDAKKEAVVALRNLSPEQKVIHDQVQRTAKATKLTEATAKRKLEADAEAEKVKGARERQQARQNNGEPMAIETSEEDDQEEDEEEEEED